MSVPNNAKLFIPERTTVIAGLLLAAGAGRRYGRPKALVELDGEPLVRRGVRLLADGGCAPVHVVLGAGADEVPDLPGAVPVRHDGWPDGLGSSLRRGLASPTGRRTGRGRGPRRPAAAQPGRGPPGAGRVRRRCARRGRHLRRLGPGHPVLLMRRIPGRCWTGTQSATGVPATCCATGRTWWSRCPATTSAHRSTWTPRPTCSDFARSADGSSQRGSPSLVTA